MSAATTTQLTVQDSLKAVTIVDCDTHPMVRPAELADHVAEPFRTRYFMDRLHEVDANTSLYTPPKQTTMGTAVPPGGGTPGSDPAFYKQQVLAEAGADYAFLIFLLPKTRFVDPAYDAAVFAAHNRWMTETWLSTSGHNAEGRLRGSLRVSPYAAEAAAAEIDTWAGHPFVSQIYLVPENPDPLGAPQFHPLYAAAARAGLPIAMHVTGRPGQFNLTPTGFPGYHLETFTQWPLYFMTNLASLVFEGVFEKFPELQIVFVEGGFSWAAPFIWRLDRIWAELRSEVPLCRRKPSDYVRDHLHFTTQPVEEPADRAHLRQAMEWGDAADRLLFASDYPHYDFDSPAWVTTRIPKADRQRIMAGNAVELFGLPSHRRADAIDDARAAFLADPVRAVIERPRMDASRYFPEQED